MNNKKKLILLLVVVVVFFGVVYTAYNSMSDKYKDEQVQNNIEKEDSSKDSELKAPDFSVVDRNGETVKMSDLAGKPMVINFWASWCGPCQSELPDFEKVYKERGDDVVFMMVNLTDGGRETVDKVEKFIGQNGYTFPVYFDTKFEGSKAYGVSSIPVTYFVDKKGNLKESHMGSMDKRTLETYLDSLMNNK